MSPLIAQQTIDNVRAYPDIVGIISDYVPLKKQGRNFVGRCPFHAEKTPSFSVSPEKQLWHCFGCHKSGDHIGFVMQMDNVSFAEAVTYIAQKVGIPIVEEEKPKWMTQEEHKYRGQLELLFAVREYFEAQLPESPGYDYLLKRGVTPETMRHFHLGFAGFPDKFIQHVAAQKWEWETLQTIGVATRSEAGNWMPRFRNRVMFPIVDIRGRTVGFGGRTLEDIHPKYINTDETALFNKRKILFGLDQAKSAIQKQKQVLVMEGYLDVIMAHQAGILTAVGTMGTALSAEHAQVLRRFADSVYLVFDADQAGQNAIERGYDVLRLHDLQVMVVPLAAKDPAEWIHKEGKAPFLKAIEQAVPMVGFYLTRVRQQWSGRIEDVTKLIEQLFPLLEQEKDPIVQRHYIRQIATQFQIEAEWVLAKFKSLRYNASYTGSPKKSYQPKSTKDRYQKATESLVFCMASSLEYRQSILSRMPVSRFYETEYATLIAKMANAPDKINQELVRYLNEESLEKMLSRILLEKEAEGGIVAVQNQIEECIATLKEGERLEKINQIKNKLKEAEKSENEVETDRYLRELQQLAQDQG